MRFDELWNGDRFMAYDALWTKLEPGIARKHGNESIKMGALGNGYRLDSICSFPANEDVRFVPPQPERKEA